MKLTLNYKSINKQMLNAETYEDIVRFVHENFFLRMSKWGMTYIDSDGDSISIDSQADFMTMVQLSGKDEMKIYVKDVHSEEEDNAIGQEINVEHEVEVEKEENVAQKNIVVEPPAFTHEEIKEKEQEVVQISQEKHKEANVQKDIPEQKDAAEQKEAPQNQAGKMWGFCQGGREMWKKKMEEKMAKFVDARVEALLPYIIKKVEDKLQNKQEKPAEPIKKKEDVNHKVKCNLCGTDPILGIRYKCTKCPLFNLCQKCQEKFGHDHNMIKMRFLQEEAVQEPAGKPFWKRGHHGGFNFPPPPPPFANNGQVPPPFPMAPFKFGPNSFAPFGFGCPKNPFEQKEEDPRFKITKKCFKLSELFGDEPMVYEDFVSRHLDLKLEDLSQLYITENEKARVSKETTSKIQEKAKKLGFYFGKKPEDFTELVSKNPASNFRQLIKLVKQNPIPEPEVKVQKSQKLEMPMNEGRLPPPVDKKQEEAKKNNYKISIAKRNECVLRLKEFFGEEQVFDYINFYNANNELSNEEIIEKYITAKYQS